METLTSYQLRSRADEHLLAVAATPGIDKFCSSLDWTLPAYEAFSPEQPLFLKASESGFVTLSRGFNPRLGRYLQPLEASWCLASPFVGHDVDGLLRAFSDVLLEPGVPWDLLYLSGVPPEGALYDSILRAFGRRYRLGIGHETRRFVADIHDGMDAFMARRGSKTRHNLRRITRKAEEAGITYEYIRTVTPEEVDALYARILAVEARSWKGQAGTGILTGGMNQFYSLMLPRLARRGALRVVFARRHDQDVAFIFGGLFGETYRGLQVSFDDTMREWSPGNLMQIAMIERLMEEGLGRYDLGSELEYKSKWAEQVHVTTTLWVWRR